MARPELVQQNETLLLNLFCVCEGDVWRVHSRPSGWLPGYLQHFFDRNFEAYPVLLDIDDLDRYMGKRKLTFEKRIMTTGDVELTARDDAAEALAAWLSTAFASGMRDGNAEDEQGHG